MRARFGRRHMRGGGFHFNGSGGQPNPILGICLPFMFMGFIGSVAISIASTALANEYVKNDDEAKNITVAVTVLYFIGVILCFMQLCMNKENKKLHGKKLLIAMIVIFSGVVVSDFIAFSFWSDVQLDSLWEYPKGVTIAHFVITMIAAIGFTLLIIYLPKLVKQNDKDPADQVNVQQQAENSLAANQNNPNAPAPAMQAAAPAQMLHPQMPGQVPGAMPMPAMMAGQGQMPGAMPAMMQGQMMPGQMRMAPGMGGAMAAMPQQGGGQMMMGGGVMPGGAPLGGDMGGMQQQFYASPGGVPAAYGQMMPQPVYQPSPVPVVGGVEPLGGQAPIVATAIPGHGQPIVQEEGPTKG